MNKENIKKAYESACQDYLRQLLADWGFYNEETKEICEGWWVGDEIGGLFCLEDDTFISMDDIKYCVDNNVGHDTYQEFQDYNAKCSEFGFNHMNLNAFVLGAPRVSDEEFKHFQRLKDELNHSITEAKSKLDGENAF